jgi:antitoxin component YwqK of YwqJK toxin-antitoxin module
MPVVLLLVACGRERVVEKYPKGDPKTIRTYGWLGGETEKNLKREQTFFFNGKKEKDAHYRHGVLHGAFADFWHTGQKKSSGKYVDGKKQGVWESYFNQYQLSSKGLYKDDLKEGPWTQFWENGDLRAQATFRGGEYVGTRKEWNVKGELILENSCFEKNDTGRYVSLHANNTPKEDYRCVKGHPTGVYERKDMDGTVVERGRFDSLGRRDGIWETFYPEGAKATRVSYRGGLLEDSSLAWYASGAAKERGFFQAGTGEILGYDSLGRLAERRKFRDGKPDGESFLYYPDGKTKSLVVYQGGQPAEMKRWHPNGKLLGEGHFASGKRSGDWKQFDAHGHPIEIAHYEDGVLNGERLFYDSLGHLARTQKYEHGYPAAGRIPAGLAQQNAKTDSSDSVKAKQP